MTTLAVDPGTIQTAFVLWDGQQIIEADTIPNNQMLAYLEKEHSQDTLCGIEMVESYGMAVGKEVFETVVWIGRFYQQATLSHFLPPQLVYRRYVKIHHCHDPRAKDTNIRQSLIDKYGPPGVKKSPGVTYGLVKHEWSAFAIATYLTEKDALEKQQTQLTGIA